MKFHYTNLIIWMKNGTVRKLDFLPGKVNVITGSSNAGKTSIHQIIDYVFFGSKSKIPQKIINENADWYGVKFMVNDKDFTIARKGPDETNKVNSQYYFSGSGEIPNIPEDTISETDLKKVINCEFFINDNIVIPFGGKKLKKGSKISPRYFMLFNSQDQNTITNSDVFFDKQTQDNYKEALDRIFDLGIGISEQEEVIIVEEINKLEREKNKLLRKIAMIEEEKSVFNSEKWDIIREAKEYGLIRNDIFDIDQAESALIKVVDDTYKHSSYKEVNKLAELKKKRASINRKIASINRFQKEYFDYRESLKQHKESLRPIEVIHEAYQEIIDSDIVNEFIGSLREQLMIISKNIVGKAPVDDNVNVRLNELKKERRVIDQSISKYAAKEKVFSNEKQKLIFIGEIKSRIKFENTLILTDNIEAKISEIEGKIEELSRKLPVRDDRKMSTLRLLEGFIQDYLDYSKSALENYSDHKAAFNYKNKKLELQEKNSIKVSTNIGSSSNYMFLHLCMFLGLHELIIHREIPFVPTYLILDQISRPYYDNEAEQSTDNEKVTLAMKLLNYFIEKMYDEYKMDFQVILLEHIPPNVWEKANLQNFYLVEKFHGDNKLILPENKVITKPVD